MDNADNVQHRLCKFEGCDQPVSCRGWCVRHYQRWWWHGDPGVSVVKILSFSRPDEIREFLLTKKRLTERGCWEWTGGSLDEDGYPRKVVDGRGYRVSRISACVFLGFDIRSKLQVLHRCDNVLCFRDEHLFIGTADDNSKDMVKKGRSLKGEKSPRRKLTEKDVTEIKWQLKLGAKKAHIAYHYGVNPSCILSIAKGLTWRHIVQIDCPSIPLIRSGKQSDRQANVRTVVEVLRMNSGEMPPANVFAELVRQGRAIRIENLWNILANACKSPRWPVIKTGPGLYQYHEKNP